MSTRRSWPLALTVSLFVVLVSLVGCPPVDPNNPDGNDPTDGNDPNDGTAAPALRASQANVLRILGDQPGEFGSHVAVLDFDGDGQDDLLVQYPGALYAQIFRGPITDDLARHQAFATLDGTALTYGETTDQELSVVGGDLDGDGTSDVMMTWTEDGPVYALRGGAAATYITKGDANVWTDRVAKVAELYAGYGDLPIFTIADLNGDGQDDFVAASYLGLIVGHGPRGVDTVPVLTPDTADVFIQRPDEERGFGSNVAVADLDGDGLPEAVASFERADDEWDTWVFPGDLAGESPTSLFDDLAQLHIPTGGRVELADLNGDGVLDIVVGGGAYSGALTGETDTPFVQVNCDGRRLRTRDWNGDGRDDLVTSAGVHYGRDSGTLDSTPDLRFLNDDARLGGPISSVAVGDLDGNGVNDLVWGSSDAMGYGGVVILRDMAIPNPPSDPNAPAEWPADEPDAVEPVDLTASDFTTARIVGNATAELGRALTVCDFDGDGQDDLVVSAQSSLLSYVFRGPLTGTLDENDALVTIDATAFATDCSEVFLVGGGDLNDDGRDDLAFHAGQCQPGYWIVLGSDAAGTIVLSPDAAAAGVIHITTELPPVSTHTHVLADADGDGQTDLIHLAWDDGTANAWALHIVHGPIAADRTVTAANADFTYSETSNPFAALPAVVVGRRQADATPMVLLLHPDRDWGWPGSLYVLPGATTGEISDLESVALVSGLASSLSGPGLADINGGGRDFLFNGRALHGGRQGPLNALMETFVALPADLLDVPALDWNDDGRDDLVTLAGVHCGRTRGQMPDTPDIRFVNDDPQVGTVFGTVAIGDFDDNGVSDLALGNPFRGHGGVVIMYDAVGMPD